MQWQWSVNLFRPPFGLGPTALLVAAALIAALWLYLGPQGQRPWLERAALLALRLVTVGLIAWMIAGPSVVRQQPADSRPVRLIVLADRSASMAACDVQSDDGETISRWQQLRQTWLTPEFLQKTQDHAVAELYSFADNIRPTTIEQLERVEPDGLSTNLYEALDKSLRDRVPAAESQQAAPGVILLLSDGHDTQRQDSPALLARLRQLNWPVYAVPVGTDLPVKDLAMLAWSDAEYLFAGQSTRIHATVTHEGLGGQQTLVTLLREGQVVEKRPVTLPAGEPVQLTFDVTPAPRGDGPLSVEGYQLVAQPLSGERYIDNNQRWIFLQVSRQRIRVAMFDGAPYWDTRFLAQALRSDPQVDLTSVFALSEDRVLTVRHAGPSGLTPADVRLPLSSEQLAVFDVIILGKHAERFFGGQQAQLLVEYVSRRGGALVLARGAPFDTGNPQGAEAAAILAPIEPVQWGQSAAAALQLELTEAGKASPLLQFEHRRSTDTILSELPGMLAATTIAQEKAASVVLLRQSGPQQSAPMAALAHQNVGAGRVLANLNQGLWQWAFLPSRMREYDSIYQQFWTQAIRWLASGGEFLPGQPVSMSLNRLMVEPGQETTVTVSVRLPPSDDWTPQLTMIDPSGQRSAVPLQRPTEQSLRYVATVRPQQAGVHLLELLSAPLKPDRLTARLAVYDASLEKLDTSARPQTLQALCAATGGAMLDRGDTDVFAEIVRQLKLTRAMQPRVEYAFDLPVVWMSLLVLLGSEWLLRRRQGLL